MEVPRPEKHSNEEDPTTYSSLNPEKGRFSIDESGLVYTNTFGEKFHEITEYPLAQLFMSKILKGIVNVSDVVVIDNEDATKFFSKEYEVAAINEGLREDEITADLLLLRVVFNDWDHDRYEGDNLAFDPNNKGYYFDFGRFGKEFFKHARKLPPNLSGETMRILHSKLLDLRKRFDIEEGDMFGSIVRKISSDAYCNQDIFFERAFGTPDVEISVEDVRDQFVQRIDRILHDLENRDKRLLH